MPSLERLVADRLRGQRQQRGWSQAKLAEQARRLGLRWTPGTVGLIETGGQRVDRLLDVASLCWIFDIGLNELLSGDADVDLPSGETVPLALVRNALSGQVLSDSKLHIDDLHAAEDLEMARIAKRVELTAEELTRASLAVFGTTGFLGLRDERAGVDRLTPSRSAQALRGHATRALLADLRSAFDAEGRDAVLVRGAAALDDARGTFLGRIGYAETSRGAAN